MFLLDFTFYKAFNATWGTVEDRGGGKTLTLILTMVSIIDGKIFQSPIVMDIKYMANHFIFLYVQLFMCSPSQTMCTQLLDELNSMCQGDYSKWQICVQ